MIHYTHQKVLGARFEVLVSSDELIPISYNLAPKLIGGER
jgi:hypothetical protein